MMSEGEGTADSSRPAAERLIEMLVARCLAAGEPADEALLVRICAEHPQHLESVRARLAALERIGMLEEGAVGAVPDRLGEFRLLRRLGGGGMGVVYLAEQPSLGRTVALKLIRPEYLFFPDSRERFRREVEAVARLQHAGIVSIHGVGEEAGVPFFTMEFVAGATLAEILQELRGRRPDLLTGEDLRRAIPRAEEAGDGRSDPGNTELFTGTWESTCLRLVRELALALEHAHARQILHRDVKPSNVMVTRTGRVLLLDFGLARLEGAPHLTRTGSQPGSLPYMSPEQVEGRPEAIDRRTDVYSLGVLLYELLTLHSPYFDPSTELTRRRILEGRVPAPRERNPSLSWEAATVCLAAMDPDPGRRHASAEAFAGDLANVLGKRPILARPTSRVRRARRWVQRHPTAGVALVLGFLLVTLGPSLFAVQKAFAFERAERLRLTAESTVVLPTNPGLALLLALERAQRAPGLAERNALIAALNSCAESHTLLGHTASVHAADFSPDGRLVATASVDTTARLWDPSDGRELRVLRGHTDVVYCVAFSPDGKRLATGSSDGTARVWEVDSGVEVARLGGHAGSIRSVAFSDDGSRLVASVERLPDSKRGSAHVWDIDAGVESFPPLQHVEEVFWATFSPDDAQVLTASYDGTACLWDARTGELALRLVGHAGAWDGLRHAEFSPDGERIVTASADSTARIWDRRSGRALVKLEGHEREVLHASFSPDGRWIATASYDGTARLWDAATGAQAALLKGHRDKLWSTHFAPDSRRVVTSSIDGTARLWDVPSGQLLMVLRGHSNALGSARFSPDGRLVLTAGNDATARLWDCGSPRRSADLLGHTDAVLELAVAPDGSSLASSSSDGTARVWDVASGRQSAVLEGHRGAVQKVRFSPDGRTLLTSALDRTVRLWEVGTWHALQSLDGHELWVELAEFGPEGSPVLTAYGGVLRLWDTVTGERRSLPVLVGEDYLQARFLRSSGELLTRTSSLDLWRVDTAEHVSGTKRTFTVFAVPPAEDRVVAGDNDGWLRVLDLPSWEVAREFQAHRSDVTSLLFDPAGRHIVTSSADFTVKIWEWPTLEPVAVLQDFGAVPGLVCFSPGGSRLLTIDGGTARIWKVETGAELASVKRDEADVTSAVLLPGEEKVALGFSDGLVRIWSIPEDLLADATKQKPRELTASERARFGIVGLR